MENRLTISDSAHARAEEFLKISGQFRLGELVTESSHPITAHLSEVAQNDIASALDLLFQVDDDVVAKYRQGAQSGRSYEIADVVTNALRAGGRIFFTGCGATGRLSILLDSIWRDFWQGRDSQWRDRTISLMAGGDFALIKSVEGFEDITEFGRRQIADVGVGKNDVVFAITEGGETSWVIGTAWQALESGAKVYFVYNNPDELLRKHVERSREIIDDPRIEKINLTTGPMAITGSTRMQATTIQLCVLLTILEIVVRNLQGLGDGTIPQQFLESLEKMHKALRSEHFLHQLANLVEMEESVYRAGGKVNYFADNLAIDVLTDTTERSPTFCIPPFKKWDDSDASDSWAFLFTPAMTTGDAWHRLLKRTPRAVEWSEDQVREMVGDEDCAHRYEVIKRISLSEIYRFRIGQDGIDLRPLGPGDAAVFVLDDGDESFQSVAESGIRIGRICACECSACMPSVKLPSIGNEFLLKGIKRVGVKMLLNALSTCIMVRLGRVMGNCMIYVVPSNLKLIDRAVRYVSNLTGMDYDDACRLVFDVIEYVEPRMKNDIAYPPVVGMSVIRAREHVGNQEAEEILSRLNC
ncbi:hypothetical protein LLG46_02945 [bacterium]|nr:hypothetical protein [bacterium]